MVILSLFSMPIYVVLVFQCRFLLWQWVAERFRPRLLSWPPTQAQLAYLPWIPLLSHVPLICCSTLHLLRFWLGQTTLKSCSFGWRWAVWQSGNYSSWPDLSYRLSCRPCRLSICWYVLIRPYLRPVHLVSSYCRCPWILSRYSPRGASRPSSSIIEL